MNDKLIMVAHDGADELDKNTSKVDLKQKNERLQIGYVGHLYSGKGMEIISKMAPHCQWADFHVLGGVEDDILLWKSRCHHAQNIVFHGYVPHSKVPGFLKSFNILLLPNQLKVTGYGKGKTSDIGSWTSPLKAFEYMSANKPILVSNIPVLKEIFQHKHNALLCQFDDPIDWALKLKEIELNNEQAQKIAQNAYDDFLSKYTWSNRAQYILNTINHASKTS